MLVHCTILGLDSTAGFGPLNKDRKDPNILSEVVHAMPVIVPKDVQFFVSSDGYS